MIGTTIAHYRIIKLLGSGGMGDVYAAEDLELRRGVALKMLQAAVVDDSERRERFTREAHAVAALNHPNIVTIHAIERAGDRVFLSMELVDGRPLSKLIPARGFELRQLLEIAIPLADAVSAAHEAGIIHRDLKPGNVMLSDNGRVKVLDFGLARFLSTPRPHATEATALPDDPLTRAGSFMGTVAYMSPEQAEGRETNARSDIFSLGIMLFELATGERPFKGATDLEILASIVKEAAPAAMSVKPTIPAELARIIRRCLAKDPGRRYQTAADIRNDLADLQQELAAGRGSVDVPLQHGRRREALAWVAALALLATTSYALWNREPAVETAVNVSSVLSPSGTTLTEGEAPQVSPDGRKLALVATDSAGHTRLYVRDRASLAMQPLPGTEDAAQPFWSPDGQSLGFFAGGQLKKIAVAGGSPQTLAVAPVPRGGTWSRDGVILFVPFPEEPLWRIAASGGEAAALPLPSGELRWFPSFLPDGRSYIFAYFGASASGIGLGSIDSPTATQISLRGAGAVYTEPGYLLIQENDLLVAQPFNAAALRLEAEPFTLAENVATNSGSSQALFSASQAGMVAYLGAGGGSQLTWFDASGQRLEDVARIGAFNSLCLAADGQRVIFDALGTRDSNRDVWSLRVADGAVSRLTFDVATDFYPTCAPATGDLVFTSTRTGGTPTLHRLSLAAPGSDRAMHEFRAPSLPTQWTHDGRFILYSAFYAATNWDIWVQPVDGGEPFAYLATAEEEKNAQLSPDGRWVAYTAGRNGVFEVYVQAFPQAGARWQVSSGGGRQPQWTFDGRLLYVALDSRLMVVDVENSAESFSHGAARVLGDTRIASGVERTYHGNSYAVRADGERLLIARPVEQTLSITLIENWPALGQ